MNSKTSSGFKSLICGSLAFFQRPVLRAAKQLVIIVILALVIQGCATLAREPVPVDAIYKAEVVNAPGVRGFGGLLSQNLQDDIVMSLSQERPDDFTDPDTKEKRYSALAISGGGANGAFGAGFLCGWTVSGDRPIFKLVTGISTGALIAPYAFLGSDYDEMLKDVYTTIETKNIIEKYSPLSILSVKESFASSSPLQNIIQQHVNTVLLQSVAKAHNEGRRLYIGTTHMDAQRLVVWNMGKIARIGTSEALQLFRDVLLASASIPTALPPVFISVEVDGMLYDEMHTDGGTATQLFFHGGTIDLAKAGQSSGLVLGDRPIARLYVIRNGKMQSEPQQIPRNLQKISTRALETALKTAALNSLFRMYVFARREQSELFYVAIPDDFVFQTEELFDREEMNKLFDIGFAKATSDEPWEKDLPGLIHESE